MQSSRVLRYSSLVTDSWPWTQRTCSSAIINNTKHRCRTQKRWKPLRFIGAKLYAEEIYHLWKTWNRCFPSESSGQYSTCKSAIIYLQLFFKCFFKHCHITTNRYWITYIRIAIAWSLKSNHSCCFLIMIKQLRSVSKSFEGESR